MAQRIPGLRLDPTADTFLFEDGASGVVTTGFEGAVVGTTTVAKPMPQSLYLTESGDTTAISVNDIHQGQIGDCFMLSPLGEMALYAGNAIRNMIHQNADGTESVTLYMGARGTPGFSGGPLHAVTQVVANSFSAASVNNGSSQDVVGGVKEIWTQVVEKAFAQANGGYAGIQNGGNPAIAMMELTGRAATPTAPASMTLATLVKDIAAGDLIVFDTGAASKTYNLVGSHAYMFEGLVMAGGAASVKLGNPWGFNQPSLIPVSELSRAFVEIDVGHA